MHNNIDLRKISSKAAEIFGNSFNAKLFREQLCYFDDIDYSEKVEYVGEEVDDETIKIFLTDIATKRFEWFNIILEMCQKEHYAPFWRSQVYHLMNSQESHKEGTL